MGLPFESIIIVGNMGRTSKKRSDGTSPESSTPPDAKHD